MITKKRKTNIAKYTALVFCLTATLSTVTGCGSGSDSDSNGGTMGRVTSISENSITIEAFAKGDAPGGMPPAASGSAADMGDRPEKPADFDPDKKPEGAPDNMPADFDPNNLPDGATPPDKPDGNGDFQPPEGKGEEKTFTLTADTSYQKDENGSKSDISSMDINPGDFVRITEDGGTATEVTVQSMNRPGK